MRGLFIFCLAVAIAGYVIGLAPVVAIGVALVLLLFLAFVRGHLDPKQVQSYGVMSATD